MEKGRREWLEWLREARSSERHVDGPDVGEIDSRTDRPFSAIKATLEPIVI